MPVALESGLALAWGSLCQWSQSLVSPFYLEVAAKPLDWRGCFV